MACILDSMVTLHVLEVLSSHVSASSQPVASEAVRNRPHDVT